ncbi:MAG: arsenosugar biosynthesis radical SAM protein ArsS [Proteobacteria bacterium]|nr:arsenosugar biosynthesis radical SAM protein ArsS [Pseudomonadota bacterium]MBU1596512.1 arsenosugar biosynthesis radical SAM protein ArsS [Pseudomonadota bacterium]
MSEATFAETLAAHGLALLKAKADCLQVNVGSLCNLSCGHCHLEARPGRTEVMDRATMDEVLALARRAPFASVDVTGGAPELNPDIAHLLLGLGPCAPRRIFRTNLLALEGRDDLLGLLADGGWGIGASLPAVNAAQVEGVRGAGVFQRSLEMLRVLNARGYGQGPGQGGRLELHLVSNPGGAFLPPAQGPATRAFRQALGRQGIAFDSLFVFANVPLGRFRSWLERSGNLEAYLGLLRQRFNPEVVCGLMCRSICSVGWDGRVYDCDFNQAAGLPCLTAEGETLHVRDGHGPEQGAAILVGEHCFACTAGSGFT